MPEFNFGKIDLESPLAIAATHEIRNWLRGRMEEGRKITEFRQALLAAPNPLPYPALLNKQQYADLEGWGHAQHPPEVFGPDPWGLQD